MIKSCGSAKWPGDSNVVYPSWTPIQGTRQAGRKGTPMWDKDTYAEIIDQLPEEPAEVLDEFVRHRT